MRLLISEVRRIDFLCFGLVRPVAVQPLVVTWQKIPQRHAELVAVLQKAADEIETAYPTPPEFVAQGDRVLVVGVASGKIKATNKQFQDDWMFDITVLNGKLTKIREYIDTQALARASQIDASALT